MLDKTVLDMPSVRPDAPQYAHKFNQMWNPDRALSIICPNDEFAYLWCWSPPTQTAGAAPLPWHSHWCLTSILLSDNVIGVSIYAVLRKYFMSWIASSIASSTGTHSLEYRGSNCMSNTIITVGCIHWTVACQQSELKNDIIEQDLQWFCVDAYLPYRTFDF